MHPTLCHLPQIQTSKTTETSFLPTSVFHYFYAKLQMEETEEMLCALATEGAGRRRQAGNAEQIAPPPQRFLPSSMLLCRTFVLIF